MSSLSPADIIEALVDELAIGELADRFDALRIQRTGPGSLLLDYGDAGRFRLDVVEAAE
jgi:hypothetical protein